MGPYNLGDHHPTSQTHRPESSDTPPIQSGILHADPRSGGIKV